ncbi:5278_t:CDS:1, partial [Gigaspora margarita]
MGFSSSIVNQEQTTIAAVGRATYISQGKESVSRITKYDYTNRCIAMGLGSYNEQSNNFKKIV